MPSKCMMLHNFLGPINLVKSRRSSPQSPNIRGFEWRTFPIIRNHEICSWCPFTSIEITSRVCRLQLICDCLTYISQWRITVHCFRYQREKYEEYVVSLCSSRNYPLLTSCTDVLYCFSKPPLEFQQKRVDQYVVSRP